MAHYALESTRDYVCFLVETPLEVDFRFKDLLVNVTEFFRDTETFEILKKKALPTLLKEVGDGEALRVWVPACST